MILFKRKLLVFFFLTFFDSYAQKPLRVGYINMDYILSNIDDYKIANEEYDLKLNLWRKEIESRKNIIESEKKELDFKKLELLLIELRKMSFLKIHFVCNSEEEKRTEGLKTTGFLYKLNSLKNTYY